MRTIYRACFTLSPKTGPTFPLVQAKVLAWATTRPNCERAKDSDFTRNGERREVGPGCFMESRDYEGQNGRAWGVRLEMPDEEPGVKWISETTLHEDVKGRLHVSCDLSVGRDGPSVSPVQRAVTRPGVVREILAAFPGEGVLPLRTKSYTCKTTEAPLLLRLLESPVRHHPVVFVSTTRDGHRFRAAEDLADRLCGLAYVIVAESADVSRELGTVLPDPLNCFDGGVRIYWPHFTQKSPPSEHPLWTRGKIAELTEKDPSRFVSRVLNRIAEVSVYTSPAFFLPWSTLIEWQRLDAIGRAKANNDRDQWLELLEAENLDLTARNKQLKLELEEKAREIARLKALSENYQYALAHRDAADAREARENAVHTVKDALDVVKEEFRDRIAFCWNSKSEDEDSPFEKPDQVLRALRWLGTHYYLAKTGAVKCPDFDLSVRNEIEGWSYEAHQSKNTMRNFRFRDWYHTKCGGRTYALPEHLKCGATKDARFSIRVAFTWCPESRRVILGYLGQHQETSAS